MNSLFESRIYRLQHGEFPAISHPLPTAETGFIDGYNSRRLTDLHDMRGIYAACSTEGLQTQNLYTTRTQDRSSGARNIRSPRYQVNSSIHVIPHRFSIFCPETHRRANITSLDEATNGMLSPRINNPMVTVGNQTAFEMDDNQIEDSAPITTAFEVHNNDFIRKSTPEGPKRVTSEYVRRNCVAEISFDLRRVYVYTADLYRLYYTDRTLSGAIAKFTQDIAHKLGLPFTDLYPLVKQWLYDSEHPIISFAVSTEFNLYLIPRTFHRERLDNLKRIILQRFDVLEVEFTRSRNGRH